MLVSKVITTIMRNYVTNQTTSNYIVFTAFCHADSKPVMPNLFQHLDPETSSG